MIRLRRLPIHLASVILTIVTSTTAFAIPQYSLLSGNRCSACHIAPAGGGLRSELGWYSWNDVSMIPRDAQPLKAIFAGDDSNTFFDGLLTLGMDMRLQNTRSFYSDSAVRTTFPMQAALYAAITPIKALTIEGSYNLAALRKESGATTTVRFPGQRDGHLSAIISPDSSGYSLRVGLFRPGVGMRYDDHTMFPYSYVTSTARQTYLAPNWSEFGAEFTYETPIWLTAQAGIFGSEGLSQVRLNDGTHSHSAVSGSAPTLTGRVIFWPRALDDKLNMYIGTGLLVNGDFSIVNSFAGIGLTDNLALMLDYTQTSRKDVQTSKNFMTELMWQVWSPALLYARWERGATTFAQAADEAVVYSAVLGAQLFVLPYVELRPEYRIWDTMLDGRTTRWNVQLHIFY